MRVFSPPVPAQGFTQRATIDPELNEIHVLSVSTVFPDSVVYSNLTNVQIPGIPQKNTGLSHHFHNSRDTFDLVKILISGEIRYPSLFESGSRVFHGAEKLVTPPSNLRSITSRQGASNLRSV